MKITNEHYAKMEAGCNAVLAAHPELPEQYRAAGLSDMRLNWDVLRAATIDDTPGIPWICRNLYCYMNDTHIGTALKNIIGNTGLSTKALAAQK